MRVTTTQGATVTIPLNSNGHKRRELRKRVLAEETHCSLCGTPVDKRIKTTPGAHYKTCHGGACTGCIPHPMRAEVDEIVPRAKGGSPLQRTNTTLMHRSCNQFKGTMTLDKARTKWQAKQQAQTHTQVRSSPIW